MARATPEAAFAEAAAAMQRGDWHAFFACVDRDSLTTIVQNGLGRFLGGGAAMAPELVAIGERNGIPPEKVERLQSLSARIVESARASMARGRSPDPKTMVEDSLRHKALVDDYTAAIKSIVKSAANVHQLTADLEVALRKDSGSGSVSTRLFVDETLEGVSISGSRARATRRMAGGATEDVAFVRRGGEWFIKPFARIRT